MTLGTNPSGQAVPEEDLRSDPARQPAEPPTTPLQVAPQPTAMQTTASAAAGDQCPSCGAQMAADQRYCLECGHRRGDPRLPFMDAVTFMDARRQPRGAAAAPPPPPPERKPRISANASLIAGVATLVLAIGVGVLIGRSGEGNSTPAANATPSVIKLEGGAEATTSSGSAKESSGGTSGASGKSGKASKHAAKAKSEEAGDSGTSKAAEEVLKPSGEVNLPPPTQEVGSKCAKGSAGCSESGEFDGSFFGE